MYINKRNKIDVKTSNIGLPKSSMEVYICKFIMRKKDENTMEVNKCKCKMFFPAN